MSTIIPKVIAAAVVALLTLALVECGSSGAVDHASLSPSASCSAPPPTPQTSKPIIAVLTGITSGDLSAHLRAERRRAFEFIVSSGFKMRARLLVNGIGSGANDSDLAVNTQLEGTGPNPLFRQTNAACKTRAVVSAFSSLMARPVSGPVNVFSSLQELASNLTGLGRGPVDVVLLSSMLNSAPPLDIAAPGALARSPQSTVTNLKRLGLVPDCAGWNVYLVGSGQTGTDELGSVAEGELEDLWAKFFAACGGQVVVNESALAQFPVTPTPRQRISSTTSLAPGVTTHEGVNGKGQRTLTVSLSGTILFATASSLLAPSASNAMRALSRALRDSGSAGIIDVTGYTDSRPIPTPGGNAALSLQRADAVAKWLFAHGIAVRRVQVRGAGSSDPVASNSTAAGRVANRRVVVTEQVAAGSRL